MARGFSVNIERATKENTDYRRVLYTGKNMQLALMSLKPGEEIGNELHHLDQFIRVEEGEASAILNNGETKHALREDCAIIIPAGTWHNIINIGAEDIKLYTLYGPPEHKDKTIHPTKEDALAHEEHFDGKTTE